MGCVKVTGKGEGSQGSGCGVMELEAFPAAAGPLHGAIDIIDETREWGSKVPR